ncbi:MAG TPA: hypothetical protein VF824_19235 [Thermoanaerobaculia bacterium]|jgi:hypothetical protein
MRHRRLPLLLVAVLLAACAQHDLREDGPGEADDYYAMKRAGTNDPQRAYAVARAAMSRMGRYSTATGALVQRGRIAANAEGATLQPWKFLGPGNVGGRTRTLVIDSNAPDVMYAGGVSGGIWKSNNGGAWWEPRGDVLANLTVNSLAMHPVDHAVLYAGTGEGYFREEQRGTNLPLRGNGIYVTRDGAASWTHLASTATPDFHFVNDLTISTHEPSRIYAATRTGVFRSNDAGASWTRVLATTVKGGCLDLAFRGDTSGDFLLVSCGTFEQATVYRTEHGESDTAWTPVLSEPDMGRTTLAIAPSNPSIVYALSASNEPGEQHEGFLAVYRSTKSGETGSWETRASNDDPDIVTRMLLSNPRGACQLPPEWVTMGWYCNTIAVDPADPERVWAGGVDLFRSDDGGRTWGRGSDWAAQSKLPQFVHADQHSIVFDPRYDGVNNRRMYATNDGGIYRTNDARGGVALGRNAACQDHMFMDFTPLISNYGVTQFYHGAVSPDGRMFMAGAQDNGTNLGFVEDPQHWFRVLGGDGGYVAIDPRAPQVWYAEAQFGYFTVSQGHGEFKEAFDGLDDDFLFITPFAMDPNESKRLWIGGRYLWRTDDGAKLWKRASTQLPAQVSAVAIAPGASDRVVAGTNGGDIVRNTAATKASPVTQWKSTRPREGFVSWLSYDPIDVNTVYATYSGFGGAHVWTSNDGGETWSSIDANLPDIPVHSIVVDPTRRDRLYLGTDLGVFVSLDRGTSWNVENTGYPPVVTEALVIGQGATGPALYAFTHGRGAWRTELTVPGLRRRAVRK